MVQHENYDTIVIGGGPAGLIAAAEIARGGPSVLVLEEHPQIGLPDHCAGLISISGLERIGVDPSPRSIQNIVTGARLIAPNGTVLEIGGNEDKAYVLDRSLFDRSLAMGAIEAGTEIRLRSRVTEVQRRDDGFLCRTSSGKGYLCRLLVDAEGISSRILRMLGLPHPSSDWVFPAAQFEISGMKFETEMAEVYFGQDIAPGFFAWSIPMSKDSSKIGLAVQGGNPLEMLKHFRRRCFPSSQVFSIRLGSVFLGDPCTKTFDRNLLVVGDAAGQTKPTTGGGVVVGGLCAQIAGRVGVSALLEDNLSAKTLSQYEKQWRSMLGGDLAKMRVLRRLFPRISDDSLNRMLEFALRSNLRRVIEERGDMDMQGDVINRLLRQPGIHRILLSVGGDVVTSLFK